MRFEYCPFCGGKTVGRETGDEGLVPWCDNCTRPLFDMFPTCVLCVAVSDEGRVALIKQNGVTDHYVGVAGYIKPGENAEEAAAREVGEELGLEVTGVRYMRSYWYDKRCMMMLGYTVFVKQGGLKPSCEVDEAKWFDMDDAPAALRNTSLIQQLAELVVKAYKSGELKNENSR